MHVYLARTSKEMHINPDVFSLTNTSPYVGIQWWCGDDVVDLPPHILMRCWAQHLRPDFNIWLHHTSSIWPLSGLPKIPLFCTEYNRPTTLPPTNEESAWAQWWKNLIGKKISLYWVKWSERVVSLDTNNFKRKTLVRVEKSQKKVYSWLLLTHYLFFKRFYSPNI